MPSKMRWIFTALTPGLLFADVKIIIQKIRNIFSVSFLDPALQKTPKNLHLQKNRRDRNFVAIFLPGINPVRKTEKRDTIWAALPCLAEDLTFVADDYRLVWCQSSCQTGPTAAALVVRIMDGGSCGGSSDRAKDYQTKGNEFEPMRAFTQFKFRLLTWMTWKTYCWLTLNFQLCYSLKHSSK